MFFFDGFDEVEEKKNCQGDAVGIFNPDGEPPEKGGPVFFIFEKVINAEE